MESEAQREADKRRSLMIQVRRKIAESGKHDAFPIGGFCYGCGQDLLQHYKNTGIAKATGCPLCNRSFVE